MITRWFIAAAMLLAPWSGSAQTTGVDTVPVAASTGERDADRASILTAVEAVQPGGTILFAPGTYRIGDFIRVPVPGVKLQGHPEGTTLRGCEPADLVDHERMTAECNGLELTGPRQTIRGLTFERMGSALWVGCCLDPAAPGEAAGQPHVGGHLIEGNTFRATWNGIRVIGDSPEAAVIRDNDFVNTWHAVTVNGRTAHILANRVSVPDAEQVPVNGHPGIAIAVTAYDTRAELPFTCAANVIAGNRIEGHPEAIAIFAVRSGASCRENVIRDNTITVTRARLDGPSWGVIGIRDEADSTLAGVPIALADLRAQMAEFLGAAATDEAEDLIHDNRIAGNRVAGAEGLAIQLLGASRNRIVDNTIAGVRRREPFPGNTMIDDPEPWENANGSGIWVSPGSDSNEIAGNTFEDIAGVAVVLEGDSNRVMLARALDSIRDLGVGNHVVEALDDSAVVFGVADQYVDAYSRRTNTVDHPGATHDALPDNSPDALRRWQAAEDGWLARLDGIDREALWGSPAWALHASLRERLAASVQMRVCRRPLWRVDPDFGWHLDPGFPALARTQPLGTAEARAAALRRWAGFGRFVDTEVENLREGLRQDYVAPRPLVELVIEQVGRLADQTRDDSPFYEPVRRDSDPDFRLAFGRVIEGHVLPALRRYREFLAQEYLPRSRRETGLAAVPWGLDCYRALLRAMTTLPFDETAVDSIGRALLDRAVAERDRVAREYYGVEDGRALSAAIAADSSLGWSSHAKALEAARAAVGRATELLPRHFRGVPPMTAPVVDTMTTEEGRNVGFGALYRRASADGVEPARVLVNPFVFDDPGSRGTLVRLMYHEGVPGHHLQTVFEEIASRAHPYLGLIDRFDGLALHTPAYSEGWASYAEHVLVDEMGIGSDVDPVTGTDARVNEALWFLLTDGVQIRGWSLQAAVDTVRSYVPGLDDEVLEWAFASAAITPGYWLAYTIGSLEIQRLRLLAERALGADFDVRDFHDHVLRHGEIPLPALREVIERWVREARFR